MILSQARYKFEISHIYIIELRNVTILHAQMIVSFPS